MAQPRYKQPVDPLAADVRAGRLLPGTHLPTHRDLDAREGLALVTATRIYAELDAMGLMSGETGRGTSVQEALPRGQGGVDLYAIQVILDKALALVPGDQIRDRLVRDLDRQAGLSDPWTSCCFLLDQTAALLMRYSSRSDSFVIRTRARHASL
jgi:DNA-binding transcriptional MocR family regulator